MEFLQTLYDKKIQTQNIHPRKTKIGHENTLLKGVKKAGKTRIIMDYLLTCSDTFLYIDLQDERLLHVEFSRKILQDFLNKNQIQILVIENYNNEFKLPTCKQIILSTSSTCSTNKDFKTLHVYPLDFEEFIATSKKFDSEEAVFSQYLSVGSFASWSENMLHVDKQEFVRNITCSDVCYEILKSFCTSANHKVSFFEIYKKHKKNHKISKDKFYLHVEELQAKNLIFCVEKQDSPRASKKIYFIDFLIKNFFNFRKDFNYMIENLVFLELIKKGLHVTYTNEIDFFDKANSRAVLVIPFLPVSTCKTRIIKIASRLKALHVKHVQIISISNRGDFEIDALSCSVLPFYTWALGD